MAKSKYPKLVVLPAGHYVPVVMKVQSRYENGVPEDLTLIPNEQSVELVGGEEFIIAYVLEELVKNEHQ